MRRNAIRSDRVGRIHLRIPAQHSATMFSTMPRKYYQVAAQAFLIMLFAVCVFRAFSQSIVHDEALTW
ncbi:MAG: hypothetical protein DMG57_28250 [Acidobacteria bacterium]|nr:MAG: hypothetical protein DMG57_28250 [Acidobacteriota bacterium]